MLEQEIEAQLIRRLTDGLKYVYRPDIRDLAALESNSRARFEELNHVRLSNAEFSRLLDIVVSDDVYRASCTLRERQPLERDDGTPFICPLVNTEAWCKNCFEVVNQLRINTASSFHRYDAILLLNGVPVVQIELKSLDISPRRAMKQIVDYKRAPGSGYTYTLLCFIQLFIVSNRTETWYFANNNRHFAFDADERFLPANLFFSTGIPVCILVLKKCRKADGVLFINAAEQFEKGKRQNHLLDEHAGKILDAYQYRREERHFSCSVPLREIADNDFNLNISRYISTAEPEADVDLAAVHRDLEELDARIAAATERHNAFLRELGLPEIG